MLALRLTDDEQDRVPNFKIPGVFPLTLKKVFQMTLKKMSSKMMRPLARLSPSLAGSPLAGGRMS
jgi:hypothetical protein